MSAWIGLVLLLPPQASGPPEPKRPLHAEVNVRIRQQLDEEREIREYHQPLPAEYRSPGGRFTSRFRFESACEAPAPGPAGGLDPQAGKPGDPPIPRRDDWPPPPPWHDPWEPWRPGGPPPGPLLGGFGSTTFGQLTLTGRFSVLGFDVTRRSSIVSDLRIDPTSGGQAVPPPQPGPGGGSGGSVPPPPPSPTRTSTDASAAVSPLGGHVAVRDGDRDAPVLAGPELHLPFADGLGGWLPKGSSLGASLRALFGSIEAFDVRSDAELLSAGLALRVPLFRWAALSAEAGLFAGPGWLHTELGDTWGFNGSAGLRLRLGVGAHLGFVASGEIEVFEGNGVSAWGPSATLGFVLGW
jgi:hypothetical protein